MATANEESWKIVFYQDKNGKRPAQEFLDGLNKTARAAVLRDLNLLKEFGVKLGFPTVRSIASVRKLWELRVKTNDGAVRVFYAALTGRRFILLHGFIKKTDKTPKAELELAAKRLQEVLAREERNG